jgi:hypothetical protein
MISLGGRFLRCVAHNSRWACERFCLNFKVVHPAGWDLSAGELVMKDERRGRKGCRGGLLRLTLWSLRSVFAEGILPISFEPGACWPGRQGVTALSPGWSELGCLHHLLHALLHVLG